MGQLSYIGLGPRQGSIGRFRSIAAAAAISTLLIAAAVSCGSDGNEASPEPQAPAATSVAASPTPDHATAVPDETMAAPATPTPVPDEKMDAGDEAMTEPKDKMADDESMATPEDKMADDESMATPEDKMTGDESTAAPEDKMADDESMAAPEDKMADDESMAAPDEKMDADGESMTAPDEEMVADDEPMTDPDEQLVTDDESTTDPEEEVVADNESTTDPEEEVVADNESTTDPEEEMVADAKVTPTPVLPEPDRTGDEPLAPELRDTGAWINSEPFTLESRRGEVVLIDFWTFSCVNCIRTLPYLRSWHDKYADSGLVILGVHAPEFEFEEVLENVQEAVDEFGLLYPIVQDNERGTWRAFRNRFWPAKYLIDRDGYIRYTHFGEGRYEETEQWIRKLLEETGADLSAISDQTEPGPVIDPEARKARGDERRTRELYAGFRRNINALTSGNRPPYILQPDYFSSPGEDVLYFDNLEHQNNYLYLEGLWRSTDESIVHARDTEDFTDYVAILFYATEVNAVMSPVGAEPFTVRLVMDEAPLTPDQAGVDVTFDDEGNSIVIVDEARMYNLITLASYGGHELTLSSDSDQMELFTFAFGAYDTGR